MAERKPQDQDKFVLRLPEGMRERIKIAAEQSNRSMNAEIVATLEEKYPTPPPLVSEISQIITLIREASRPISLEEKKIAVNRLNSILEKADSPIIASIEHGKLVLGGADEGPDPAD